MVTTNSSGVLERLGSREEVMVLNCYNKYHNMGKIGEVLGQVVNQVDRVNRYLQGPVGEPGQSIQPNYFDLVGP